MQNKRRFSRILFSTPAKLMLDGTLYDTSIIDLSFKGALVNEDKPIANINGARCNIRFTLPESDIHIEISGQVVHTEDQHIGIRFDKIDIDSMTHLKRIIELNLGDEDMLHRELESLSEN